ncbi:DUF563 domain-containing protein [Halomonas sp. PA5]|nr:DUF563 domain-containing protein [Halomonas sp. PA5]
MKKKAFISLTKASRRRLINKQLWSVLEPYDFQRAVMEKLSFEEQV